MVIRSKRAQEKIAEQQTDQSVDDDQQEWIDQFYAADGLIIDGLYNDDDYDFFSGAKRTLDDGSDYC